MDVGFVLLIFLLGAIALTALWANGISPIDLLRPVFSFGEPPQEPQAARRPAALSQTPQSIKEATARPRIVGRIPGEAAWHPRGRQHTAVAGETGAGKTSTMNTLLVADILSGAQCIVCSTHFAYYHPEDQPIDLRPLKGHFEAYVTPAEIMAALVAACEQIDIRMLRYRAGQRVGHDIVLYLGEWDTSIQRVLGDAATERLLHILDEGRKTNVWVGFIEAHGAQVKRFGGDGALRSAFKTRLAGNVDDHSWRMFVGKDMPKQDVPRGYWMTERGLVEVRRPTNEYIASVARAVAPSLHSPLVSTVLETEPVIPVRPRRTADVAFLDDTAGIPSIPDGDTSMIPGDDTDEETSDAIRTLYTSGWSMNRIAAVLKLRGSKQERNARIKAALHEQPVE